MAIVVFIGFDKGMFAEKDIKMDLVYVQSSAAVVAQLTAGSSDDTAPATAVSAAPT